MQSTVRRLGSQAFVYGLGYGLTRLIQFILLPLYTRYLTPADYGILALLLISGQIAIILTQAGLNSAMFREIIYRETDPHTVESTTLIFLVGTAGLFLAAVWPLSPWLSEVMFSTPAYGRLLRFVFLTSALGIFESVLLARLRIRQKPAVYAVLALGRFLLGVGLTVYFLVVLGRGLTGLIEATLLTAASFAAISLSLLLRDFRVSFDLQLLRRMLRFGGPLVPTNVSLLSMTSADRYILQHFATTAQVGIYSLGYQVSLIINLAVNAINLAWPAQMFEMAKQPEPEHRLARMFTYYVVVVGFVALAISVLARDIVIVMTTPAFHDAARVVPVICLAYLFYGMGLMVNSGLAVKDKMKYGGMLVFVAALINLGLNFVLVPRYGMMGAACSALISFVLLFVMQITVNLHFWRIPYEYRKLALTAATGLAVFSLSRWIPETGFWSGLAARLALLAAFPLLLRLAGLFRFPDLKPAGRTRND